ncbi:MAG: helicase RepA family protein [Bacteroidia bacterium]|nr:helicase RepA family protein [Bacteroidia bacterium]
MLNQTTKNMHPKRTIKFDPLDTKSLHELKNTNFPETNFFVKPFLPEGLTILGGKPKIGKSFFALQLAYCIAKGINFMGKFPCKKSNVYLIPYEDNERRISNRLKESSYKNRMPKNVLIPKYASRFPQIKKGGYEALVKIISKKVADVIIIDTMVRFLGDAGGKLNYSEDYEISAKLQSLASMKHVSILLIHHTTKKESTDPFDDLQGSVGYQASADSLVVMRRIGSDCQLGVRGRDYQESYYGIKFSSVHKKWKLKGDVVEYGLSRELQTILKIFKTDHKKEFATSEIQKLIKDASVQNTSNKLKRLTDKELVIKSARGFYKLNLEKYPEYK